MVGGAARLEDVLVMSLVMGERWGRREDRFWRRARREGAIAGLSLFVSLVWFVIGMDGDRTEGV